MANTDYKSPDALMRHLRDNGISISGSSQKQQLIMTLQSMDYPGVADIIDQYLNSK